MNILALDLALTRTGYATHGPDIEPGPGTITTTPLAPLEARLWAIGSRALDLASAADLIIIEDVPAGRMPGAGNDTRLLGMVHGVVRTQLWLDGRPIVVVQPAQLKKYATGRGNAPKAEVLAAAIRRLGYAGHDDNEADALWLATMAADHYGPLNAVPAGHRVALTHIDWPAIP